MGPSTPSFTSRRQAVRSAGDDETPSTGWFFSTRAMLVVSLLMAGLGGCGATHPPHETAARVGALVIPPAAVDAAANKLLVRQRSAVRLRSNDQHPCRGTRPKAGPNAGLPRFKDSRTECERGVMAARVTALRSLIRLEWLRLEVVQRGLTVTRDSTPPDIQRRIDALQNTILRDLTVTAADITRYYDLHRSSFGPPRTRDAWFLRTRSHADVIIARNKLQDGASWEQTIDDSVAHTSINRGAAVPFVQEQQADKVFDSALFAARVGHITGPLRGAKGWYLLQVIREHTTSPPPGARAAIVNELLALKLEHTLTAHYGERTSCASDYRRYGITECS